MLVNITYWIQNNNKINKKIQGKNEVVKTKLVVKEVGYFDTKLTVGLIVDSNLEVKNLKYDMLGKKICDFEKYDIEHKGKQIKSGVYYLK